MFKEKVQVGLKINKSKIKRIFINLLSFPAWFSPWKGFRRIFHRMRGTKIGKKVEIGYMVFIDNRYPELIEIQDNATITSNCTILAHDLSMRLIDNTEVVGQVIIKEGAFIGMNSTIMPGVTIGKHCIVGCGSIVTKDTEDNSVYLGSPARIVKKLNIVS